jgi:hypothetical protein
MNKDAPSSTLSRSNCELSQKSPNQSKSWFRPNSQPQQRAIDRKQNVFFLSQRRNRGDVMQALDLRLHLHSFGAVGSVKSFQESRLPSKLMRECVMNKLDGPRNTRSQPTDNESEHYCNQDRVHDRPRVRLFPSADSTHRIRNGRCAYQLLARNL